MHFSNFLYSQSKKKGLVYCFQHLNSENYLQQSKETRKYCINVLKCKKPINRRQTNYLTYKEFKKNAAQSLQLKKSINKFIYQMKRQKNFKATRHCSDIACKKAG